MARVKADQGLTLSQSSNPTDMSLADWLAGWLPCLISLIYVEQWEGGMRRATSVEQTALRENVNHL